VTEKENVWGRVLLAALEDLATALAQNKTEVVLRPITHNAPRATGVTVRVNVYPESVHLWSALVTAQSVIITAILQRRVVFHLSVRTVRPLIINVHNLYALERVHVHTHRGLALAL